MQCRAKGVERGYCQLNVLSGVEGSKEKADTPAKQRFGWPHMFGHNARSLPQWINPWYLRNHKGDEVMTETVVSVTVMGGIDRRARQH